MEKRGVVDPSITPTAEGRDNFPQPRDAIIKQATAEADPQAQDAIAALDADVTKRLADKAAEKL